MCVFKEGFMRLGPYFSCFGHNHLLEKIFLGPLEKANAGQNRLQTVLIFFPFFLQHFSLTLFQLCPRRFWQSTFSTDPWWYFKELCFRKDIHLV